MEEGMDNGGEEEKEMDNRGKNVLVVVKGEGKEKT